LVADGYDKPAQSSIVMARPNEAACRRRSRSWEKRMARLTGMACMALMLSACASGTPHGELGTDHLLAGRIFRMADGAPVSQAELVADAAAAEFVLIGERRGNPEHQRVEAELVAVLEAIGDRPRAVAFEMIPAERQLEIVEYLQDAPDAAGLGAAIDWDSTGWPDWRRYQPIAQAALDNDALIVAAGLDEAGRKAAFAQGAQAFRSPFVRRTGLAEPWPAPMMVAMQDELRAVHCGETPAHELLGMVRVERARDAMMADRLAATAGTGGGVLIAGNGHVRKDRGVPWYLARLQPDARSVSIGLLEVQNDSLEPALGLPYDYVWYTPRAADRGARCEQDATLERVRQAG
jgi:uncharacterized iron-regulated protein